MTAPMLHALAAVLFGTALIVARCTILLAPGRLARRMARWSFALSVTATRTRGAARRAS